jgi:hypothetical protein
MVVLVIPNIKSRARKQTLESGSLTAGKEQTLLPTRWGKKNFVLASLGRTSQKLINASMTINFNTRSSRDFLFLSGLEICGVLITS